MTESGSGLYPYEPTSAFGHVVCCSL